MNAQEVLNKVKEMLAEGERYNKAYKRHGLRMKWRIDAVYSQLGIFDWWNEYLSMTQLKQMEKFLEISISLGYTGYVCFKVGAAGCAHGMWAHKEESTTGYSPDGPCIYHSFRSGDNYYDACLKNGEWVHEDLSLKELKAVLLADSLN